MSIEWQTIIATWGGVAAIWFLVAALLVDHDTTPAKDRVWIGRIGLAAPLWPLVAVVIGAVVVGAAVHRMYLAARGRK